MALIRCNGSTGVKLPAMPTADNKMYFVHGQQSAQTGIGFGMEKNVTVLHGMRTTGGSDLTVTALLFDADGNPHPLTLSLNDANVEVTQNIGINNALFGVGWYNGTLGSQQPRIWFS